MTVVDIAREVDSARQRIQSYLTPTPLLYSETLSAKSGLRVHLKLENKHPTGSFKLRGAFSKLTWLRQRKADALVVAASTGNHALALAYALDKLGMQGRLFLPQRTSRAKLDKLECYGVPLEIRDEEAAMVERYARCWARRHGAIYVSPYNDLQVVAGQGTLALEVLEQLPSVTGVYAAVGGGGLVSGIAGYLKCHRLGVSVVGCQPENDAAMFASIEAGQIIDIDARETLSDGTAGGIEPNSFTFAICRHAVTRWQLVSEEAIVNAMRLLYRAPEWPREQPFEGAAGVAIAGLLRDVGRRSPVATEDVVLVICGANIDSHRFEQVLSG